MSDPAEEVPATALEDVAFLARSENRLRLLAVLADDGATRRELEEATGIARATVGRALADFEERGWARETAGRTYEATPTGSRLAAAFSPFLERIAAIRQLGDRVAWLPTDEVRIDLRHFSDATIRRPKPADPLSPAMSLTDLIADAAAFHCLVGAAPPLAFEREMHEGVVDGDLETRHVITAEELSYLAEDPDRRVRWREYVEAGANLYRYDGDIPCNVLVFDGIVIVGPHLRTAGMSGLIESRNEAVYGWADELIDRYRREAVPVTADAFS